MESHKKIGTMKEVTITIKKCVDKECVWRSDKYQNGCGKYPNLQTCIDQHGKMLEDEAIELGLI